MDKIIEILSENIRRHLYPINFEAGDYDPLLDWIGDARYVLIGEATHGTHEFYRQRAAITRRLIEEKGFCAVAVEADWPDAYRVNSYVKGESRDESAEAALGDFRRFPLWMWRNHDVLEFVEWMRSHNAQRRPETRVGFFGMDLYSLYNSMGAVIEYLETVDPEAAQRARYRYSCFEQFNEDPQAYGYAASFGLSGTCEADAVQQLVELQHQAENYLYRDGRKAEDAFFFTEQNARLIQNAERYYRAMFKGRDDSWNLRDTHMADTLEELTEYLGRRVERPRIVVWAHNSHLGDARATEMGRRGEINVGQLVRERHPGESFHIGFSTYHGTVAAASDWDGPVRRKQVRPGLPESVEALMHQVEVPAFMLPLRQPGELRERLAGERLERAIGVIYRPDTERLSHTFQARLPEQFDALIHIDETSALRPLDAVSEWERSEVPDTYPYAI